MASEKICISWNNVSRFFCIREGIQSSLFESLLKEVFGCYDSAILGLQSSKNNVIFDIGEFCNSFVLHAANDSFQLITGNLTTHSSSNNTMVTTTPTVTRNTHSHRSHTNTSARGAATGSSASNGKSASKQQSQAQSQLHSHSSQRNKSTDFTAMQSHSHPNHRNSLRYSIKSASKYSSEEACQFYIEDYEVFMTTTNKDLSDSLFCFLFFDETKMMRLYGAAICRSYQSHFPSIDFYYSLYPSKRSRGPFSPSDCSYLLSFFHGQTMIFEREVAVSLEISEEMVKALNQYLTRNDISTHSKSERRMFNFNEENTYTENSFSMINQLGSESCFQRHNGSFSDNQNVQDRVFELIECLSQSNVRRSFNDEEFKNLLKLVRKNNKKLNHVYEQFKVYNDHEEFVNEVRNLMNLPTAAAAALNMEEQDSPLILAFEHTGNKAQKAEADSNSRSIRGSSIAATGGSLSITAAANTTTTIGGSAIGLVPLKSKKPFKHTVNEMSFDVSAGKFRKVDFTDLKNLKDALRRERLRSSEQVAHAGEGAAGMTNGEIGYIVFAKKQGDSELEELLESLNAYSHTRLALSVLKAYAAQKMTTLLSEYFSDAELAVIYEFEHAQNSPIHAAFLNWMVLGNLQDLTTILAQNIKALNVNSAAPNNNSRNKQPKHKKEKINSQQRENQNGAVSAPVAEFGGVNEIELLLNATPITVNYNNEADCGESDVISKKNQRECFRYSELARRQAKAKGPTKPKFSLIYKESENYSREEDSLAIRESDRIALQILLESHFTDIHTPNQKHRQQAKTFKELLGNAPSLSTKAKDDLQEAFEQNYPPLFDLLNTCIGNTTRSTINPISQLNQIASEFEWLKSKLSHLLEFESPISHEKLQKFKGFLTTIGYLYHQNKTLMQRPFKTLSYLYLEQDVSVLAAYEQFCVDGDLEEFLESARLIEQVVFFSHKIDFAADIESNDDEADLSHLILFLLRSTTLSALHLAAIQKTIKFGDRELLRIFNTFSKNPVDLMRQLILFAEQRAQDLQQIERTIEQESENEKKQKAINTQLDMLFTYSSLISKKVKHISLIERLVKEEHNLVKSAFEVLEYSKDRQDFVESIGLIYEWKYIEELKNVLPTLFEDENQVEILVGLIDNKDTHVMAAWELQLKVDDLPDFKDTLLVILNKYL